MSEPALEITQDIITYTEEACQLCVIETLPLRDYNRSLWEVDVMLVGIAHLEYARASAAAALTPQMVNLYQCVRNEHGPELYTGWQQGKSCVHKAGLAVATDHLDAVRNAVPYGPRMGWDDLIHITLSYCPPSRGAFTAANRYHARAARGNRADIKFAVGWLPDGQDIKEALAWMELNLCRIREALSALPLPTEEIVEDIALEATGARVWIANRGQPAFAPLPPMPSWPREVTLFEEPDSPSISEAPFPPSQATWEAKAASLATVGGKEPDQGDRATRPSPPPEEPPVRLGKQWDDPVFVFTADRQWKRKEFERDKPYRAIEALAKVWPSGLTGAALDDKAGCTEARRVLRALAERDDDWGAVLSFPGEPWKGGYKLTYPGTPET